VNRTYRTRHANGIPGWGPAPGWGQPLPGWSSLVDHGPLPLRAAGSVARWWWPILVVGGFLAVVIQVLDHDDPTPGLAPRGLFTIALAAAVVVLLTLHRSAGPWPLARAVAEYAVVALLAVLLAASGAALDQQPATRAHSAEARTRAGADDPRPGAIQAGAKVVRAVTGAAEAVNGAVRWLADLWRQAERKTEPANSEAMAASPRSPAVAVLLLWRSP
jgi:hypothetical protein